MSTLITIPPVERDTRIGSVFNMLFVVINSTEAACVYDEVIWDFSETHFFHPFFICGLSLYRKHSNRIIKIEGVKPYTRRYLDAINFYDPLSVNDPNEVEILLNRYLSKSYIPICKFNTSESTIDSVTSALQNIIQRQCEVPSHLISALSYLIGELVANIHDHSGSEHGYMFSQYSRKDKCINVCIADFGVSIYGSFAKSRILNDIELSNEGAVLNLALNHKSTKNLPNAENRGYGLPTTKNMLVKGMKGEFFILSGGAFHRHDRSGEATAVLPKRLSWDGTIILLRIPLLVSENFNYLKYAERL